jgi:hypothetical protein
VTEQVSAEFAATLRGTLGLPATATGPEIMKAVDQRLYDRAQSARAASAPRALPDGVVLIETDELDRLRAAARAGVQAQRDAGLTRFRGVLAAAVQAGKTTPAKRAHWETAWRADPEGTEEVLAALAPGSAVPVGPLRGTVGGDDEGVSADEAVYRTLFADESRGGRRG